jgi:hypothetical protein
MQIERARRQMKVEAIEASPALNSCPHHGSEARRSRHKRVPCACRPGKGKKKKEKKTHHAAIYVGTNERSFRHPCQKRRWTVAAAKIVPASGVDAWLAFEASGTASPPVLAANQIGGAMRPRQPCWHIPCSSGFPMPPLACVVIMHRSSWRVTSRFIWLCLFSCHSRRISESALSSFEVDRALNAAGGVFLKSLVHRLSGWFGLGRRYSDKKAMNIGQIWEDL